MTGKTDIPYPADTHPRYIAFPSLDCKSDSHAILETRAFSGCDSKKSRSQARKGALEAYQFYLRK